MYKVLIVEDEEMIRKGLSYTFDWNDMNCVLVGEAKNGKEGLEKIEELKPDIVLTDVSMPVMGGIDMLKKSISSQNYCAIIISGYNEFHLAKQAIQLGVTDYLLKPLEHEQLCTALQSAIKKIKEKEDLQSLESKIKGSAVQEPVVDLVPNTNNASEHVANIMDFIAENYSKKIVIQDIVDELGMSSTYLHNKFKKETKQTITEYLNRYRIQKSIELMKNEEGKIYTIATEVGFQDYKYFISVFKKYVNCTPSKFMSYITRDGGTGTSSH